MQLKFSLFDAEDLKLMEDMLARAMVRAARTLAREGLFGEAVASRVPSRSAREMTPPSPTLPEDRRPAPPPRPPSPTYPAPDYPPHEPTEEQPVWPPTAEQDDAVEETPTPAQRPIPAFLRPPPEQPWPPGRRPVEPPPKPTTKVAKKRRSAGDVCKTVADRPFGYITTDEAYDLIDVASPSGTLSNWIQDREVQAVIVANYKPPTKGLPGRLMVLKESLVARNDLRKKNKTLPPVKREIAPTIHQQTDT